MDLLISTKNKISNYTKVFDSTLAINSFIGISVAVLGYYTFFENNIETPLETPSPSESIFGSPTPTPSESIFGSPTPTPSESIFGSPTPEQPKITGGKRKKTKKRK